LDNRLTASSTLASASFSLTMSQTYTTADVAKHKDAENGFWLIVENDVYDVTSKSALPFPIVTSRVIPTCVLKGLADGRHSRRVHASSREEASNGNRRLTR
jgi:hypothetical protein